MYAFGYGLSYTRFDYKNLKSEVTDDAVNLTFSIRNAGKLAGDEVAQVYVTFPETGIKVPLKQLKGFERVHIEKGKTARVTISVPKKELRLWDDAKGEFYTPTGNYIFMVGAASDDIRLQKVIKL